MLKYRNAKGRSTPFLTCDACHKSLGNAQLAGVACRTSTLGTEDGEGDVLFAHKGPYMHALERSLGQHYDSWGELGRYLSFVVNNVGLSADDVAEILQTNREWGV